MKMKVRTIRYKRVFPVGQFANEQMEWEAYFENDEGELDVAAGGMAQLFERSISANRAFDKARKLDNELYHKKFRLKTKRESIEGYEVQIQAEEDNITRLVKQQGEIIDEPETHEQFVNLQSEIEGAEASRDYQMDELKETNESIRKLEKEIKEIREQFDAMLFKIRSGDFDILEKEEMA